MKSLRVPRIDLKPPLRLLGRKRALFGMAALAGLFVVMALVSSSATGQAARGAASPAEEIAAGGPDEVSSSGSETADSPSAVPNPGLGSMAVKVIGSVLLLIGILYAGVYGMRVLSGRAGKGGFNSGAISVLHKTHIAPKKAIYVVKVGGKAMVVGVTDSQINHLADLSGEELESLKTPEPAKAGGFKQHLLGFALGGKERA